MIKIIQSQKTSLSYAIDGSATTFKLKKLLKLDGTPMSASDIGDSLNGTIDPGVFGKEEIININGSNVTVNSDNSVEITGVLRGRKEVSPYGAGGYATDHGAGAVVVFGNNPQLYDSLAFKANANTFTQQNIFSGYAPQTDTDPVAGNDLTRLSYVQALVLGTLTTIDVVVPGTAGETIADGNSIYLNTDNKWYKTDADTASTVNNVLLGIAKGAGTLNNAITNGILLQGTDNAQSGLVAGEVQYASNTAGAISNTPGTNEVTVGIAKSATELYFSPRFNQQLTENQQDALDNALGGALTGANPVVSSNDTAENTASKLVRRKADSNITVPATPTASTDAVSKGNIDTALSTAIGSLGSSYPNTDFTNSTYFTKEVIVPATSILGWGVTSCTGRGGIGVSISAGGSVTSTTLYTLTANTKNVVLDTVAILNQQSITQVGGLGIFDLARSNDTTTQRIAITNNATDGFEFTTCDGSARTSTTITGVTATNMNKYTIVKNGVTSVLLYVNGVLKANHTTNLPTSTAIVFKGTTVGNSIELLNPIISIEI